MKVPDGVEKFFEGVRFWSHNCGGHLHWLWDVLRPMWRTSAWFATGGKGFRHNVNGIDSLRISFKQSHNAEKINWEPEQYCEMMSMVHLGDQVIDIGAFWGLFSLGSALRVGHTGRIVAVEPSPQSFSILRSNIRSNRFDSIIIAIEEICADIPGRLLDFYADSNGSMVDSTFAKQGCVQNLVKRRTTSVEELTIRFNLTPKIIKIDAEGFEHLIIKGAEKTIERFRPIIFIEFHPEELRLCNTSVNDVLSYLDYLGYKCIDPMLRDVSTIPRGHLFKFFLKEATDIVRN